MVFLEPPRSRMLSKHREEARRRQHSTNTGTTPLTNTRTDPALQSFRSAVDNYVSFYKGVAKGTVGQVRQTTDQHAASQRKLATNGRTNEGKPNVAVVRPSSASVVSLSRDAPFHNQYTVSDIARRSSGTCGGTAEKRRSLSNREQSSARASEERAADRPVGGREQEDDEEEGFISPVTGLAKSFYKEAAVYAEAREKLSSGKLGAPPGPSAALLARGMGEIVSSSPLREAKGSKDSARDKLKGILPPSYVSPPRPNSSCDFASTALGKIKQQLCSEADETFKHLQRAMRQRLRQHHDLSIRRHGSAESSREDEDHMLPLLVEAITNESMRSANEQQKTVVESSASSLGLPFVGCLPPAVDFSSFAESNALLEFIGGSRSGQSGMSSFQLSKLNESERLAVDVLGPQLRRGFSHRGLDIADELPIAISFPTYDNLAANSADGKRPITDKRYNVHSRCVLVGALVVPSRARARQRGVALPEVATNGRTTIAAATTLPTLATTLTAETQFEQQKRREARERIKAQKAMQLLDLKASSPSAETRAEAAIEAAKRLSVAETELARPKTDEAILEEVLLARRGYRVADEVIAAVEEKMRNEAKPLRPMREVKRVPIPEFVEYADCRVRPLFLACYEVPNNRIDAPTRSTLDPAVMMTTKVSMYDDLYPFEKLEFTMRWGTPIRFMGPEELAKDCWVRKVVRFPVFAEGSPSPSACTSPSISPRRPFSARSATAEDASHASAKASIAAEEVPLGVLLQACGRGAVSIDVEGRAVPGAAIPPLFYRHSFLFAERGVAAVMRERRYGKNSRHVSSGYSAK